MVHLRPAVVLRPGVDWNCDGIVDTTTPVAANVNGSGSNDLFFNGWTGTPNEVLESRNDIVSMPYNAPRRVCRS